MRKKITDIRNNMFILGIGFLVIGASFMPSLESMSIQNYLAFITFSFGFYFIGSYFGLDEKQNIRRKQEESFEKVGCNG